MKLKHISIAALLAVAGLAANAQAIGSLGGNASGTGYLTLSSSNVSGGSLLTSSIPNQAAEPVAVAPGSTYLSVGPSNNNNGGGDATLTFTGGASKVSFDWGTPDTYNLLTVKEANGTSTSFTASQLGLNIGNFDGYVSFFAEAGTSISSFVFSSTSDAFEVGNFTATPVAAVPEPTSVALMLAGLVSMGLYAKRRNRT